MGILKELKEYGKALIGIEPKGETIGEVLDDMTAHTSGGSGGFKYITGTREDMYFMNNLETGVYIADGFLQPYENADITIEAIQTQLNVLNDGNNVYVVFHDLINDINEWYEIAVDGSSYKRAITSFGDLQPKQVVQTSSNSTVSTTLADNTSYQVTVALSRLILKFPSDMQVGYKSEFAFFTNDTAPTTFTINMENIKWHGDNVVDNAFTPQANKTYTIQFQKYVSNFIAEVREV